MQQCCQAGQAGHVERGTVLLAECSQSLYEVMLDDKVLEFSALRRWRRPRRRLQRAADRVDHGGCEAPAERCRTPTAMQHGMDGDALALGERAARHEAGSVSLRIGDQPA